MDRIVSTIILVSVLITLAMILSTYYTGFFKLFITYYSLDYVMINMVAFT